MQINTIKSLAPIFTKDKYPLCFTKTLQIGAKSEHISHLLRYRSLTPIIGATKGSAKDLNKFRLWPHCNWSWATSNIPAMQCYRRQARFPGATMWKVENSPIFTKIGFNISSYKFFKDFFENTLICAMKICIHCWPLFNRTSIEWY